MNSEIVKNNKKYLLAFITIILLIVAGILFEKFVKYNYIEDMIRVIEEDCNGREVTNEEYDKLNPPKDLFYPFATVLTKKEYYDDGKCAIYMNYKQSQIDTFNKVKHDEVSKLFYYVESYFPDDNSNVGGSFAVEIREYSKDDIAKDKYLIESEKIHEYCKWYYKNVVKVENKNVGFH